jgi:hypothetical protein
MKALTDAPRSEIAEAVLDDGLHICPDYLHQIVDQWPDQRLRV